MKTSHKISIVTGTIFLSAMLALNAEYWVLYLLGSAINALPIILIAFPIYLHMKEKKTTANGDGQRVGNEKNDDQGLSIDYTSTDEKST
jgi:hypothetical protein